MKLIILASGIAGLVAFAAVMHQQKDDLKISTLNLKSRQGVLVADCSEPPPSNPPKE